MRDAHPACRRAVPRKALGFDEDPFRPELPRGSRRFVGVLGNDSVGDRNPVFQQQLLSLKFLEQHESLARVLHTRWFQLAAAACLYSSS